MDTFAEKSLSPRLVKLRYDFFEAKRKDLLAATRRARDRIVAEEQREAGTMSAISRDHGVGVGALMALNSDGLKMERQKLLKAQEIERKWLSSTLNHELHNLQVLESNNKKMEADADDSKQKMMENAQRIKELNDRRREMEEQKQRELQAQQKLEKQIAKEEFMRQQNEMHKMAEKEAIKKKEAHERQLAEADRKRQQEREKQEKKERAWMRQQQRLEEMRAADMKRMEILEKQKQSFQIMMHEKKDAKESRIRQSIANNNAIEDQKRMEYEDRQEKEHARDERLAQARALQQEEGAKRSFQLMMKRRCIADEANRRNEDRRNAILEHQEEMEHRLMEHEQKKERYLDFKRELDMLKGKNKEINVLRQRRRDDHRREQIAEQVQRKDEKMAMMSAERNHLWNLRRMAQSEAMKAREAVKQNIMNMRIKSKYDSRQVAGQLNEIMSHEIFNPGIVQSTSMPALQRSGPGAG